MAKVVFVVVAEYDGPVAVVRPGMDDDADSYMNEMLNDAVGTQAEMLRMDGVVFVAADDATLDKAKQFLTGVSD